MWFFIGAIVVIALFALWFRRTNMYRSRRGPDSVAPGQEFGGGSAFNPTVHRSLRPPRGGGSPD
jgi:hypothetical protein